MEMRFYNFRHLWLLAALVLLPGSGVAWGQAPEAKEKPVPRETDVSPERAANRDREGDLRRAPLPKDRRLGGELPGFREKPDPFGPHDEDGRRPDRPGEGPPRGDGPRFGPPGFRGGPPGDNPFAPAYAR